MLTTVRYALAAGALFLLFFVVSVGKPGLPVTLKADEPAYYLMALSLLEDGDLEAESQDYRRVIDGYPYLPTENLILMSDPGGDTVYFGKPYIYSLLAAPLAALFGANGFVALNALLFCLMIGMGASYLGRFNPVGMAALFSTAFFFLSPTFHYVFWLQPEILNMASAMACLFFAFHHFDTAPIGRWNRLAARIFNHRTAPWWSAATLAFGTYNKPILALVGIPALFVVFRRSGPKRVVGWMLAAVITMGAISLGSVLLTGHLTPYLGVVRTGLKVEDPAAMEAVVAEAFALISERSTTGNSWTWIFRLPQIDPHEFLENVRYFAWGRHTGLLLYMPFAVASLVLFLLHQRRSSERWLLLASVAAVGLFFLLFIPFNWHGGGGFVGNRYFVMMYPAFLFLSTSLRPFALLPVTAAFAGVTLGTILFTPFGAPVSQPTLQAHVRGGIYRHFPLELSLRLTVPGYNLMAQPRALLIGRKDLFQTHRPSRKWTWIDPVTLERTPLVGPLDEATAWIYGATSTRILVMTEDPVEGIFASLATWAPDNTVRLDFGGTEKTVTFEGGLVDGRREKILELRPGEPERFHYENGKRFLVYELEIEPETGKRVAVRNNPVHQFYLGAQFRYLGRRDQVDRPEHYRIEWREVSSPDAVAAGEEFEVPVVIRNTSASPLGSGQPLPVFLSYHWFDERGQPVVFGGKRTPLVPAVEPGSEASVVLHVIAPDDPGRYMLAVDAVREHVAWFSQHGAETPGNRVEVLSPDPDSETPG
jgi:hypothetical protein